jgi:hypothetical protein
MYSELVNQSPPGLPRWFKGFCTTFIWNKIPLLATSAKAVKPPGQAR